MTGSPVMFSFVGYPAVEVVLMPRQARQIGGSGIYHVMLRGMDRMQPFTMRMTVPHSSRDCNDIQARVRPTWWSGV